MLWVCKITNIDIMFRNILFFVIFFFVFFFLPHFFSFLSFFLPLGFSLFSIGDGPQVLHDRSIVRSIWSNPPSRLPTRWGKRPLGSEEEREQKRQTPFSLPFSLGVIFWVEHVLGSTGIRGGRLLSLFSLPSVSFFWVWNVRYFDCHYCRSVRA